MNWINRFLLTNWSHIFEALLLTMALLCGIQIGGSRIQKAWDLEMQKIARVQAKQEQHVADVRQSQSQIAQEISHEFAKRSKLLADRQPNNRVGRVCDIPATGGRDMPSVSDTTARITQNTSDPLPAPRGDTRQLNCSQLAVDATHTTLMLTEIQQWYQRQLDIEQYK